MKIVIAGGGKVGSVLCAELTSQKHDVMLIETNETIFDQLMSRYDLSGVIGNAASYEIQQEVGINKTDIFIAVTDTDEINIIASILAKSLGARYTVARVRNPEYSQHAHEVSESLGIDLMINPEQEAAKTISHMIKFPTVVHAQKFMSSDVELLEVVVKADSPLENVTMADFKDKFGDLLVCAIVRSDQVIVPNANDTLKAGDRIDVLGSQNDIYKFYQQIRTERHRLKSVMIIGGGRLTYYLLNYLREFHLDIKVIEWKEEAAEQLSAAFPEVEVILGDSTEQELLLQEGVGNYDVFVSLLGIDEENIMASLFAQQQGVSKVITKVNREALFSLFKNFGLDTIITPKRLIANSILRFVRSLGNPSVSYLEELYRLSDNQAELIQFKVNNSSKVLNTPLEQLNLKDNTLIAYILRDHKTIIPSGQDRLEVGDHVIIMTNAATMDDIDDILR
ncbi:Trk system potassium transporter TrkA [Fundicoccus culcitae]|uniref:Trk system potassium uptake protein TrkA n=1 Tax=Fundicoccus culcitae TaxID=2969821 RepID=A0ABY5P4I2_9LACT|nr:Trk system potassium transporter TrkA [Fundicoccus culcitae]UUX33395.1 Trk system potassium transporter TrkA [Fundicoccus culcitae]